MTSTGSLVRYITQQEVNRACEGLRERELEYRKHEEDYRDEIARRRQRSGKHRREMEGMMEQLSLSQKAHQETTEQLSIAQQEHKRCQDVLCEIALLTPAQRKELADLFAATRAKMDPFLSE
jgi:hypothetical protein